MQIFKLYHSLPDAAAVAGWRFLFSRVNKSHDNNILNYYHDSFHWTLYKIYTLLLSIRAFFNKALSKKLSIWFTSERIKNLEFHDSDAAAERILIITVFNKIMKKKEKKRKATFKIRKFATPIINRSLVLKQKWKKISLIYDRCIFTSKHARVKRNIYIYIYISAAARSNLFVSVQFAWCYAYV